MRVLVCGGRDYDNRELVFRVLDRLHAWRKIECIIHGGVRGADDCANYWAVTRNVHSWPFSADWKRNGPGAGPRRNERMLRVGEPNLVVAFPGGRGTKDMMTRAYKAGVATVQVNDRGETSFLAHATRALTVARAASNVILGKSA